jgi:hypothetical protein
MKIIRAIRGIRGKILGVMKQSLTAKGHRVVARGKKSFVKDTEKAPIEIDAKLSPIEQILILRQQIRGFVAGPKISRDELHERHRKAVE